MKSPTEPRGGVDATRGERASLAARLSEIGEECGASEREHLAAIVADPKRTMDEVKSHLSTELMDLFRRTHSKGAFGLLYELNRTHLLGQVVQRVRRYQSRFDPNDLLQEVFFNIYRYPRRFDSSRPDAFRIWTTTIVRNTVLKQMRSLSRSGRAEVPFEDLSEQPEGDQPTPLGGAIEKESEDRCMRVYLVYLHLYLEFYKQLSEREQKALRLVEVEGASYRDAADELGIKIENLKMVIFRARKKIQRAMKCVFDGQPASVRPARDPRPAPVAVDGAVGVVVEQRAPEEGGA